MKSGFPEVSMVIPMHNAQRHITAVIESVFNQDYPFGLVPFEAMMRGMPVIVTDDCGRGEIVDKEEIGYTVGYNDLGGLTEKTIRILSNMDEARKIAGRSREVIKSRLSWESLGNLYEDACLSVIR